MVKNVFLQKGLPMLHISFRLKYKPFKIFLNVFKGPVIVSRFVHGVVPRLMPRSGGKMCSLQPLDTLWLGCVTLCHVVPRCTTLCHAVAHVVLCCATLYHVVPRCATRCVMLCHVVSRCATLYSISGHVSVAL